MMNQISPKGIYVTNPYYVHFLQVKIVEMNGKKAVFHLLLFLLVSSAKCNLLILSPSSLLKNNKNK